MEVVVLYYISAMVAIIIHELGHLLAVWHVKYKFLAISIGPLSIVSNDNRLAFKFRKALFSGQVNFQRVPSVITVRNEIIVLSSGIVANVMVGVFLIYLYFAIIKYYELGLLLIFGVVSIFVGIANLVPKHYKSLGLDSDALQLLKLYRHTQSQRKYEA